MDPQQRLQAWVKEHRTLVREETGGKLTTQELAKELARRWKALDKQEKSSYKVGRQCSVQCCGSMTLRIRSRPDTGGQKVFGSGSATLVLSIIVVGFLVLR